MNGRVQLQNASFNTIDATNGISNANGVIALSGKTATIQSLTGESGGGTVSATGSATFGGGIMKFQLAGTGHRIRVRYPEGASTIFNTNVRLNGTTDNSTLAGNVTIERIAFNPRSDFGSMLSNAATPVQTPAAPSPLLSNMHLNLQVQTAPSVEFQTSLAQNVELVANLRISGTAATPGAVGRINITQGKLVFFGAEYTVSQGLISFYDPLRIAPMLNINLETTVQGVNITLNVSGPSDNMTLTHRSDPPLPFNDVMGLLATGKAPASDPTIAAHMAPAQPQSVQQMGESAMLSQTVANPLATRLQRVFGVSQIKIAPAFVGGSSAPQARMTLQQQVSRNVTFTYITDLTNSNEQVVQVEWALNPTWSAVATRDENGIFSVDFFYKRKIK
jgi:translocation and assembly module TamB